MIILVMGVAGSGKTTLGMALAARRHWCFADADDWHSAKNLALMREGIPLGDRERGPWLDALAALVAEYRRNGQGLVLACSALRASYRGRLGFPDGADEAEAEGWREYVEAVVAAVRS